jgi:hypothetical protein
MFAESVAATVIKILIVKSINQNKYIFVYMNGILLIQTLSK